MPEYTAPHPALQNALFLYATGTDGAAANLIRGWSLLVDTVVSEVAGDNWPEALADLDEWQDDGWGVPHHYYAPFEDGYMHIFTVREPVADGVRGGSPDAQQACNAPMKEQALRDLALIEDIWDMAPDLPYTKRLREFINAVPDGVREDGNG
jgi:hypothetical protein